MKKENGKHLTVGFTCSAFDLLHPGHLAMLEEAKGRCDWLIVGLQSDPSIDRSNKNKPIQSVLERTLQLRATRFVDEIIVYDTEEELEQLLKLLPIDVRILGEEYRGKTFTGRAYCAQSGIDIHFNKRRHDLSSSSLRDRIKEAE